MNASDLSRLRRPWAVEWTPAEAAADSSAFWRAWWGKTAITWDHSLLAWADYDRPFLAWTSPQQRILEAGCGQGGVVRFLEDHGRRFVVGLDFSVETLRAVRSRAPDMKLVAGDVRRLPFRPEVFDCVFSLGVVEHFPEGPEALMSAMHASLRPAGRLIFTVPYLNLLEWLGQRCDPRKRPGPDRVFYQYLFRRAEARQVLDAAGFRIASELYCNRLGVLYHYYHRLRAWWRPDTGEVKASAPGSPSPATRQDERGKRLRALSHFLPATLTACMILLVGEKTAARSA